MHDPYYIRNQFIPEINDLCKRGALNSDECDRITRDAIRRATKLIQQI